MELKNRQDFIVKCVLTLAVVVFAFLRQPEMLLEPRFWAEEGTSYFAFAYNNSFFDNLLSPQYGYYTLYNSIATSLALLVDLEFAPHVTTYLAFIVQVAVSAAVIWWQIPLLDSLFKKFIVALAIQYLAYSRIWVTTIGVQYWLCILSLLILLHDERTSKKTSTWHMVILLHNGLTGVLTCFMVPAFAYKAWATKSKRYFRQTALLTVCSVVQVGVFLAAMNQPNTQMARRLVYCDPVYMLSKLLKFEFSVPFFGQYLFQSPAVSTLEDTLRQLLYRIFGEAVFNYKFSLLETAAGLVIVGLLAVLFYYQRKSVDVRVVMISLIFVTVFSTLFSVNMSSGPRYTFSPSVMIMLFVVSCLHNRVLPAVVRWCTVAVVLVSVGASLFDYRLVMGGMAYDPTWPKWRDELAIWRQNPDYQLQIWPPGWSMTLRQK